MCSGGGVCVMSSVCRCVVLVCECDVIGVSVCGGGGVCLCDVVCV